MLDNPKNGCVSVSVHSCDEARTRSEEIIVVMTWRHNDRLLETGNRMTVPRGASRFRREKGLALLIQSLFKGYDEERRKLESSQSTKDEP